MWNFKEYSALPAVITDQGERITYQELDLATESLAQHVGHRGLVFSLCTNSIGSLVGYAAFIRCQAVPLMLGSSLDGELLQSLIEIYRPSFLWVPKCMVDQFAGYESVYQSWGYALIREPNSWRYPLSDDLALLLPTSGSTGSPKLVRLSYENLKSNTRSIVDYLELDEFERPITTLPMNYSYGLSIINSHLAVGATLLLTDQSLMEKGFWSFLREQKATSIGGVPYTYAMLERLRFQRMGLDSLKTMTQAGGKLSTDLHQKFAEYALATNKRFVVMYGQTEATARMAYLPHTDSLEKCGSVGIAIPGGSFSILDANGREVFEPGVIGELVYRGPNVSLGYAESGVDLNKGDELQGRLPTGDIARLDADGYCYIVGRKKRFLKIFGNRLNLDETESLIRGSYQNIECACAGVDDKLYVFITGDSPVDDIKKMVAEKTGLNHVAFKVKNVDVLPKNDSGKILYTALEQYFD